jgi:hypothetical protein
MQRVLEGASRQYAKRSMLLYLASLKYGPCNIKPRVFCYLEQTQFGSIKPLPHLFQGHGYRVATGGFSDLYPGKTVPPSAT